MDIHAVGMVTDADYVREEVLNLHYIRSNISTNSEIHKPRLMIQRHRIHPAISQSLDHRFTQSRHSLLEQICRTDEATSKNKGGQ